ncbi:MAG: phage portal protein [Planctomycetota bacterium]
MSVWSQEIAMAAPAISGTENPEDWFVRSVGGIESDAGVRVNADSAMTLASWWQAVQIISGDTAALPIKLYRWRDERTKEAVRDHPAYVALNRQFHPEVSPFDGREAVQGNALVHGNGLAHIDRSGRRIALTPLDTRGARVRRSGGQVVYLITQNGKETPYLADDILHIRGLGVGVWGHSVVDYARNSLGMALALQKHGSALFKNGARPDGLIKSTKKMEGPDRAAFREDFERVHSGVSNRGRVAILPPGLEYDPLTMTNEDAQWLESMRFSREEVAAWFNLPPHKLGALENSSVRANIEAQNRSYIETTLERWLRKWEQQCERKLLTKAEYDSGDYFFRFNLDARLRGDIQTRTEAQVKRIQNGISSVNEIRNSEDMNPAPHGDRYMMPLNMAVIDDEGRATSQEGSEVATVATSLERALKHRTDALLRTEAEQLRRCGRKGSESIDAVHRFYSRWVTKVHEELAPFAPASVEGELLRSIRDALDSREAEIAERLSSVGSDAAENMLSTMASNLGDQYQELRKSITGTYPHG